MLKFIFKNLERTELAESIIESRLRSSIDRFPHLKRLLIKVTLSRENSLLQPGPDCYGIKLFFEGKNFGSVVLEKKSSNLYSAAAELNEALLERFNRLLDRSRILKRQLARKEKSRLTQIERMN